ncbi:cytidylate kinase-like family protein [Petralouisia muris]|uniref:Cytidylate kinase-like family protein n=1 Tax=Petralouisia muris TaxID=3032872 RepID=A0AC61S1U2_9FIRM|nr:cytidylate kinase-like family protein [Petralouisia muris]TGY97906.1 cytidylate kinase-like family protein [Petralouisia muris]
MRKRIITISREFGSGGHTIGNAVAEKLGITCYDRELLEKIAEGTGFSREFIESAAEDSTASHSLLFNMVVNRSLQLRNEPTPADTVFFAQMEIIRKIAEKEECVIVGRCSDYILRERKDCLNVFIYADEQDREKRILQRYGENEKPVKKRIADKDSRRKTYYSHYTDRLCGMPQNYHICLNSSALGEESCIDIICRIFREVENETA